MPDYIVWRWETARYRAGVLVRADDENGARTQVEGIAEPGAKIVEEQEITVEPIESVELDTEGGATW